MRQEEASRGRVSYVFGVCCVLLFLCATALFYAIEGEKAQIAVHDNLDLFVPQYKILKESGTFFAGHATVPFLGGIDRDYLPSEYQMPAPLYLLFPAFTAYVLSYLLKVLIAVLSGYFLAKECFGSEKFLRIRGRVLLCALGYGVLNLFPNFGIAFASLPFLLYLLLRIYRKPSVRDYILLFCYPTVSYFSYFGFFLLTYLFVAILVLWVRSALRGERPASLLDRRRGSEQKKKGIFASLSLPLLLALPVFACGYVCVEYRLFRLMLFSHTVSIRSTMQEAALTLPACWREAVDVFRNGMMHVDDRHLCFVMPLCLCYLLYVNLVNLRSLRKRRKAKRGNHGAGGVSLPFVNLCFFLLILNSLIYGLYDNAPVRDGFFALLPPLQGFQFNRTIFLNPFLWYLLFGCILCDDHLWGKKRWILHLLPFLAMASVFLGNTGYNDLYHSAYSAYYRLRHEGRSPDEMSFGEFYSAPVFDKIKKELSYQPGEYAAAYGMYPAVLEYNGIATVDGYLGYYPQAYKEKFRRVIAPALDRVESSRQYFDGWGARCYLVSGTDSVLQMNRKSLPGLTDRNLYIDPKALRALHCKYLFSRIPLANAQELGLTLLIAQEGREQAYPVYVYGWEL